MNFDPLWFKQQFPLFAQPDNQKLVYLDNAATTQKPAVVIDAITDFYLSANGNANRASHRLARAATEYIEQTRTAAARFFNATSATEIVFTSGATEGINVLAYGLRERLQPGDEIVLTTAEHHANIVPWQETARSTGAKLIYVKTDKELIDAVSNKTQIVSITAASNGLGVATDLSVVAAIKSRHPDLVSIVDASQRVAHEVIDVQRWQCDFLVCSAHKMYGPTGVGLLYGREALLQTLPPLKTGGEMVERVDWLNSDYASGPARFEAGTSALAAIASLGACLAFWQQLPRADMHRYEKTLTHYLHDQLHAVCKQCPSLRLLTQPHNNIGIATLAADALLSINDLAIWLDQHDIAVRAGHHCAQPLFQSLEVSATLRVSLAAYNTENDIDQLIAGITDFFSHYSPQLLDRNNCKPDASAEKSDWIYDDCQDINWHELTRPQPWQTRYRAIMHLGKALAPKPVLKQPQYLVKGCESATWLASCKRGQCYYFAIDSDSAVVKGLAVLLLCRVQGLTAAEIQTVDFAAYFTELELSKHLSPSRTNGVTALLSEMLNAL